MNRGMGTKFDIRNIGGTRNFHLGTLHWWTWKTRGKFDAFQHVREKRIANRLKRGTIVQAFGWEEVVK